MQAISRYYTLFWMIYFPVCIVFRGEVNFDWSDEIMACLLCAYAVLMRRYWIRSRRRIREITTYVCIMAFYFVYSLMIHITTTRGVFLDILQQLRPYFVFYSTWMLAPSFGKWQKRLIIGVMLFSLVVVLRQNFAGAENLYESMYGSQAAERGQVGWVALTTGMIYYLFTEPTKRNKYIAIAIMLLGLAGGKSKYYGQCVAFIYIVTFVYQKINFRSSKTYFRLALLAALVVASAWSKFNSYYVEGMQEENSGQARPETYKTAITILKDYFPFGPGLGTFATAAAAKEYSPLYHKYKLDQIWGMSPDFTSFIADAYYPTLAEFGVVGVILFCVFWRRRIGEIHDIDDITHYRMALMAILALGINSTADSAYLSGPGMGFFMVLAVCLNSNINAAEQCSSPS